jgi:hypothetical protein
VRVSVGVFEDVRHSVGEPDCVGDTVALRDGEAQLEEEGDKLAERDSEGDTEGVIVGV